MAITPGSRRRGPNVPLLLGVAVLIAATLGGGFWYLNNTKVVTDPDTGCKAEQLTPEAMLVLVDETDKLTRESAERIRNHLVDKVREMPRYSRVLVVPFGGDVAQPLKPIFDECVPGKASDAGIDEGAQLLQVKYEEFKRTLDGLVDTLMSVPSSDTSPITQQVIRAASDADVLHWHGEKRRLYLVTDGLESSVYWTRDLHLSDPPDPDFLKGVEVEYFEVGNQRNASKQDRRLREEWRSWFERAGAQVRMTAPGYS